MSTTCSRRKPWIYNWLEAQFNRKWNNETGYSETKPFVPLPPDRPSTTCRPTAASRVPTTGVSLSFYAGLWAHNYDIYFGTTPNPPLLEADKHLGPSQYSTDYRYYPLPQLQPGTVYYWKVVSKTMANVTAAGPVWSFRTAGGPNLLPIGDAHLACRRRDLHRSRDGLADGVREPTATAPSRRWTSTRARR